MGATLVPDSNANSHRVPAFCADSRRDVFGQMAQKLAETLATPAGFEPATTRLEGECSIQLSYGAGDATAARVSISHPIIAKIIGIAFWLSAGRLRGDDRVGQALPFGEGFGLL
jgi:hypothetical protein